MHSSHIHYAKYIHAGTVRGTMFIYFYRPIGGSLIELAEMKYMHGFYMDADTKMNKFQDL